jgi:hypothetical protein
MAAKKETKMKYAKIIVMCAGIAGVMVLSTRAHSQTAAQRKTVVYDPPHARSVAVPQTGLFVRRLAGANGSEVVMFEGYNDDANIVFRTPNQGLTMQNGCFTQRIGTAAIMDVSVFCTMFIWDYKKFVGADDGMRKPENSGIPSSQWSSNTLPNALLARNQVRYVSGPATVVAIPVQSGIVRSEGTPGVDHGKVVVGFTIKPTVARGSVVVSIDGDPRINNIGTSDDFTRTITW